LHITVTISTLHHTGLTASFHDNLVKSVPDYQTIMGFTAVTDDQSMSAEREQSRNGAELAENRVSGSGAVSRHSRKRLSWSGRPRSGCHKNRLEHWAANRPLTLCSHALQMTERAPATS